MNDKQKHKLACGQEVFLRVCKGLMLLHCHSSEDNSDDAVWWVLDPFTHTVNLARFTGDELKGATVILYSPQALTKRDVQRYQKAHPREIPNF